MIFYLSGGIEFKKKLGGPWREWLTKELEKIGHEAIDPVKLEASAGYGLPLQEALTNLKLAGELEEVRETVRRALFRKDMLGIQNSHAVVLLYDQSVQRGAGTLAESWEAFREGRPVYLVTEFPLEKIPTWLIGETTAIFDDFGTFLNRVEDHAQVMLDILVAKKAREEALAGIY
jgi:hypothetical protein